MAPASKLYFFVVLLVWSTFFFLRSSAEDDESGWTTVRPEVRHLVGCGNMIYASVHRIQPLTLGGIKLRGGTLFRLYGPQFQIHSLYRSSYDDFDNHGNVQGITWIFSKGLRRYEGEGEGEGVKETSQQQAEAGVTETGTGTGSNIETESREAGNRVIGWSADSNRDGGFNSDWFQTLNEDVSKKAEQEGEELGWGRISRADVSDLGQFNVAEQEESDGLNSDSEAASAVLESNLRKAYEEAYKFRKSLDDAYFGDTRSDNEGRANSERRLDEYWEAPSDEILAAALHYVLIAFAFLAVFSLLSLATYSHSVCSEEATVFVVDAPDHSTPLLQTYVVSDTESESPRGGVETEHGVVLYQPPPEIEKK